MERMIAFTVIVYLLFAAAVLIIAVFISREFERIAIMKGHPGRRYFWCTLLLGVVGMLMVIALPDLYMSGRVGRKEISDELPEL